MTAGRGPVTFWGFIQQILKKLLADVLLSGSEALFYEGKYQHYIEIRTYPDPMYPKKTLFRNSYITLFETQNLLYRLALFLADNTSDY